MAIGTIDRTPPPLFRQGPSAFTRLVFFAALALFAMAADTRWQLTPPLRSAIATALLPAQQVLNVPVRAWVEAQAHFRGLVDARRAADEAHRLLAAQSQRAEQVVPLAAENARLRALLELAPRLPVRSLAADVLYEAPDPFSRRLLIDRGARQGVVAASPVMNEEGVIGQVTRVYPLNAEVTLLVDKDAAIPVMNQRTLARSAAYGAPAGAESSEMELRFMPANADVLVGDLLVTSGVDGIYPPGLPVAKVAKVERQADSAFARIALKPVAGPDGVLHLLVLQPLAQTLPSWPAAESALPAAAVIAGRAAVAAAGLPASAVSAAASTPAAVAAASAATASASAARAATASAPLLSRRSSARASSAPAQRASEPALRPSATPNGDPR
jgi:rod shape-determining protein MreC